MWTESSLLQHNYYPKDFPPHQANRPIEFTPVERESVHVQYMYIQQSDIKN